MGQSRLNRLLCFINALITEKHIETVEHFERIWLEILKNSIPHTE